ncbi:hypothetical protein D9758_015577 [Tetrapyrgos nigripes]|uniref:L-lactate dehydrogenase (cytochrome) n=1 Tax=Tetrapyrgos nigripes TaxID=182062 RepID=A0A8H5CCB0_9AGAR|nr:hypothetical protein D9758_015577 [Tetrapyrgos nigripes]
MSFLSTITEGKYPTHAFRKKASFPAQRRINSSCWIIINNHVYDVTVYLGQHPGGAAIILKYAGRDATLAFEPIHPQDTLERNLPATCHLGIIDSSSAETLAEQNKSRVKTKDELRVEEALKRRPPLHRMLSLYDLEDVARKVLPFKALSFYSSGADDEITLAENARAFSRFFFSARVMRPVSRCDPSTTILGYKSSLPIFVSAAALAKLGHPLGELNILRGCAAANIIQMVATYSSISISELASAAAPSQTLFFQLYKPSKQADAKQLIQEVEKLGYKAIFLTVDAVVLGNRERDVRSPWLNDEKEAMKFYVEEEEKEEVNLLGTSTSSILNDDKDMSWDVVPWMRSVTKLPIILKGIQSVEDAVLAAEAGVDGIVLSNHGGRQLEYSLPPLEVLYGIHKRRPDILTKMEVYIDCGVRRGTDVVKALCLGAKAVGLGRPFLFAQSAYGEAGVNKLIEIMHREIITTMRLVGASSVKELTPDLVERVDWESVRARL